MKVSEIFEVLCNTYASPYPDKHDDKRKAFVFFRDTLRANPDIVHLLKPKLDELMARQKNMKGKFSSIILDKYWEKEFSKIKSRSYNPNQK